MGTPTNPKQSWADDLFGRVNQLGKQETERQAQNREREAESARQRRSVVDFACRLPRALTEAAHKLDDGIVQTSRPSADGESVIVTAIVPSNFDEAFLRPWTHLWAEAAKALLQEEINLASFATRSSAAMFGVSLIRRFHDGDLADDVLPVMSEAASRLSGEQGSYLRCRFWYDLMEESLQQLLDRSENAETIRRVFASMSARDQESIRGIVARAFYPCDQIAFFGYFTVACEDADAVVLTIASLAERILPRKAAELLACFFGLEVQDGRLVRTSIPVERDATDGCVQQGNADDCHVSIAAECTKPPTGGIADPASVRGQDSCLPLGPNAFVFEGATWRIRFDGGDEFTVLDSKGLRHISNLLACPFQQVRALYLQRMTDERSAMRNDIVSSTQPDENPTAASRRGVRHDAITDKMSIDDLRKEAAIVQQEIRDCESLGDCLAADEARAELADIMKQIAADVGLDRSSRRFGSAADRARQNVSKAISAATSAIRVLHEGLANHLDNSITRGANLIYQPATASTWDVRRHLAFKRSKNA